MTAATAADVKKAWGDALADARSEAGRLQMDVANSAGLDQKTISNAERGVGSLETFLSIAAELGVILELDL